MMPWASVVLCAGLFSGPGCDQEAPYGYLWQPAFEVDAIRRPPATRYEPQPGDIVVFNTWERLWKLTYYLALSSPPSHSGLIVLMPDGELYLMEGGMGCDLCVELLPLRRRLDTYRGEIYVRQRKTPLNEEQVGILAEFGLAVNKRSVPAIRYAAQVTPIRSRGPVRTAFLARPRGTEHGFFCSELVVEACVAAGLLDAETSRPAATYPRDLFYDYSSNWYLNRYQSVHVSCGWHPPALWTADRQECPAR